MKLDLKKLTDLSEKGAPIDGVPQSLDRRLFMQLVTFGNCRDTGPLQIYLEKNADFDCVLYKDINNLRGIALLTMSEDPEFFVNDLRHLLKEGPFSSLELESDITMFGRTYAMGHEKNLEDWLLERPKRTVFNKEWPWAIWYPLRRKGSFAMLEPQVQAEILREHGIIGHAFGEADLGHDVRLVSHGLDRDDNDFVLGLVGKDLFPLSALVQTMRSTKQTSTYIEKMGPFFAGKVVWSRCRKK